MAENLDNIENEFVKLWIQDGIVHEYFKVERITVEMARKIVEDRLKLSNRITRPIFIYSNNVKTFDKAARDYFGTEESLKYLSASAMLVDNYVTMMVAKLFLAFTKPSIKVEIFKSEKKALQWLQNYKHLN
jgi:hypothetical protein